LTLFSPLHDLTTGEGPSLLDDKQRHAKRRTATSKKGTRP
jgi:hypothetical protein